MQQSVLCCQVNMPCDLRCDPLAALSTLLLYLQVDADSNVLRGKLGEMLNAVLGRQAHKTELAAWFSVSMATANRGPFPCSACCNVTTLALLSSSPEGFGRTMFKVTICQAAVAAHGAVNDAQ